MNTRAAWILAILAMTPSPHRGVKPAVKPPVKETK